MPIITNCELCGCKQAQIDLQKALIRELVEGLEKLQWGGGSTEWAKPRYRLCGECNGDALKGHKPDCWLSALIKRGREAK